MNSCCERVGSGMRLFVIGLAKKVILAGLLGTPFYALKALEPQALSVCGAWLGDAFVRADALF